MHSPLLLFPSTCATLKVSSSPLPAQLKNCSYTKHISMWTRKTNPKNHPPPTQLSFKSCIIPSISTFFLFLEFYLFSFAELISNGFYSFFASKSIKKTERTEKLWIIQGLPVAQFVLKPQEISRIDGSKSIFKFKRS